MLSIARRSTGSRSRQPEANTHIVLACTETDDTQRHHTYAQIVALLPVFCLAVMKCIQEITPAKRRRLLKTFGPESYTRNEPEQFLDLLYGMYSYVFNTAELCQIVAKKDTRLGKDIYHGEAG